MAQVKPRSDEDGAEDEMLERVINESVLKAMLDVTGHEESESEVPQAAGPEPFVKECPVCKSACRYLAINVHDKILTCENINCNYPYTYEQLQMIRDCSGDETTRADVALSAEELRALAVVGAREIHEYKNTLKKQLKRAKERRAHALA